MGFEVHYKYHERTEGGSYNRDETKTFKKKVGDPFEDVPLEKLAAAVMAQLARRDVYVFEPEIYELSKKPINFKESKGGIILKNKKFLFDGGGEDASTIVVEDIIQQAPPQQYAPQYQQANGNGNGNGHYPQVNIAGQAPARPTTPGQHPHERQGPRRPVDWVTFAPELQQMTEVRQKNLRFTPDKKYPVFEKRTSPTGVGEVFVMLDDTGREQLVSDKYFVPGNVNLFGDKELGFSETPSQRDGGRLYWGGANQEPDMPVLRR
jgi:hypothetical protein